MILSVFPTKKFTQKLHNNLENARIYSVAIDRIIVNVLILSVIAYLII